MDPNKGELATEEEIAPISDVIPLCDRGAYSITNADKDEDENL